MIKLYHIKRKPSQSYKNYSVDGFVLIDTSNNNRSIVSDSIQSLLRYIDKHQLLEDNNFTLTKYISHLELAEFDHFPSKSDLVNAVPELFI